MQYDQIVLESLKLVKSENQSEPYVDRRIAEILSVRFNTNILKNRISTIRRDYAIQLPGSFERKEMYKNPNSALNKLIDDLIKQHTTTSAISIN